MPKNHDVQRAGDLVPVKFSRLTRRGVLLGLSLSQLVALGLGVGTLVWAFYAGGGSAPSRDVHARCRVAIR